MPGHWKYNHSIQVQNDTSLAVSQQWSPWYFLGKGKVGGGRCTRASDTRHSLMLLPFCMHMGNRSPAPTGCDGRQTHLEAELHAEKGLLLQELKTAQWKTHLTGEACTLMTRLALCCYQQINWCYLLMRPVTSHSHPVSVCHLACFVLWTNRFLLLNDSCHPFQSPSLCVCHLACFVLWTNGFLLLDKSCCLSQSSILHVHNLTCLALLTTIIGFLLSHFLIGQTFVRKHSWEYSANIVGS